ncbi:hypothetical protein DPMN_160270 [Dreissena polymorpha]|uniref:Uncharacterized protein n=1 Tax=Dreissena polymorpha TaxID=45954 RepID=A0A9D4EQS8_DREPO|nr:hypothetical protein DPMN_160270 [Dreissena polymorpha]
MPRLLNNLPGPSNPPVVTNLPVHTSVHVPINPQVPSNPPVITNFPLPKGVYVPINPPVPSKPLTQWDRDDMTRLPKSLRYDERSNLTVFRNIFE